MKGLEYSIQLSITKRKIETGAVHYSNNLTNIYANWITGRNRRATRRHGPLPGRLSAC